ncbi:hypothetical protein LKL54_15915, partial [Listeria monocytogenes ATCC 19115]|nr:hypothetical protein [Listeria monocytogenes ATCC 19115]
DVYKRQVYNDSVTLEAIRTKQKKTKVINTKKGFSIRSTSTPILYPDGTGILVVLRPVEWNQEVLKKGGGGAIGGIKRSVFLGGYKKNKGSGYLQVTYPDHLK